MPDFYQIQTQTGWGQVLKTFADWCQAQPGWDTLDVGCGPGLLPSLFAQRGCRAFGVDLDKKALFPHSLYDQIANADAMRLPFSGRSFDLVTASNLLFLLPEPVAALAEMTRLLRPGGQITVLNPSEHLSVTAATALAGQRGLQGVARDSLVNWAALAEANQRWGEAELHRLFAAAGLQLTGTVLKVGPGLARFARAVRFED